MKAKKLLLAGLTVGLALTVASCGSSKPNFIVPEEGFVEPTEKMTITFSHTMGDKLQKILNTAIAAFQSDHPNIEIRATQVGGYDDVKKQITTDIPNGLEPNFAYCYPDHVAAYNRARAVVQLDDLISHPDLGFTQDELNDFIEGYYNEGKEFGDGHMYTLPFSKSTEVLYYNKTVFDAEGFTVPTTWDEMMTLCQKIKDLKNADNTLKYPNCIPLGIDSEANLFITLCEQTGSKYTSARGNHYLFDNKENRSYVEKFRDWHQDDLFTTQKILNTYTSSLFTAYAPNPTTTSDTYSLMSIGSTGGASHQYPSNNSFEVGVAAIPTWTGGKFQVISQGPSLCIFNKENPQEVLASWIFIKNYLLKTDFQAAFSKESGYNPVLNSTYETGMLVGAGENGEDILYKDWLNSGSGKSADGLAALTAKKAQEFVESYFTSPAFNGSSKAREQVGDLFVAVITKAKDTNKAFRDALEECDD